MNTQDEKPETVQTAAYNPFPEPQTIPGGWDLSEFIFEPDPVSGQTEDDPAGP